MICGPIYSKSQIYTKDYKHIITDYLIENHEKPECFKYLEKEQTRYLGIFDKKLKFIGYLAFRIIEDYAQIHLEIHAKISHNNIKHMQAVFNQEFVPLLKEIGIKGISVAIPQDHANAEAWPQFISYFGFDRYHKALIAERTI